MLSWALSVMVLALWLFPGAGAQATNATCLPFFDWATNSHKQSSCVVASSLLGVCSGGAYNVAALPDQTHYLGPTLALANPCQCNTVVYSLMSACGLCQGRTIETWSAWSANCATVSISSYPEQIPSGTFVPGWAYLDVKAQDTFDETAAKQNANATESTAVPSPTIKISSTSSTITPSTTTTFISQTAEHTATGDGTASSTSGDSRVNAIAGGIVGGAIGLALLCGVAYWYAGRRRRAAGVGEPLQYPAEETVIEPADMRQYLANTVPVLITSSAPSINNSSLASPAMYTNTNSSMSGSARSVERSNV